MITNYVNVVNYSLFQNDNDLLSRHIKSGIYESVKDLLAEMNNVSNAEFKVGNDISNQRMLFALNDKVIKDAMVCIIQILNHGKEDGGYKWQIFEDVNPKKKIYILKKLGRAFLEDENELKFPVMQISSLLKNTKRFLLGDNGIKEKINISRDGINSRVLQKLSDSEIEKLVLGEAVPIQDYVDEKSVKLYKDSWVKHNSENNVTSSINDNLYEKPVIRLRKDNNQSNYVLCIYGAYDIFNSGSVIDPYQYSDKESPNSGLMPEGINNISNDRTIDLTPFLDAKNVSEEMKTNLSFILKCLHNASDINIVHENFLYNDLMGNFQGEGIKIRKGKLKDIFYEIWNKYGYKCIMKNGVYYLWSPSWAFNRRADVNEEYLTSLKKEREYKKGFNVLDWMDIGSRLNMYQIKYTLPIALKFNFMENGNTSSNSLECLVFVSSLPGYLKKSLFDGATVWWQNIPTDYRLKLNPEVMNELDYNRPPISYDKFSLMTAQGEISLSKRIVGAQTVENVTLNLQDASGKFLFYGSFQGLYTKPVAAKPAARPLPKRR